MLLSLEDWKAIEKVLELGLTIQNETGRILKSTIDGYEVIPKGISNGRQFDNLDSALNNFLH